MELREISIGDIYPDENNPRRDFGDIEALAKSCMLNTLNPGEPISPIIVVQDGSIYRIVEGERRYKAMMMNGLDTVHAVVCEDMDDADVVTAMLTTDDKLQLKDSERSIGVQRMLLLGVDPETVEFAGKLKAGEAARVRRARDVVQDAGDQMSLDQMLAIGEFDEDGDTDAVALLADADAYEWRSIYHEVKRKRKNVSKHELVASVCEEHGIELCRKAPRGSRFLNEVFNINKEEFERTFSDNHEVIVVEKNPETTTWYTASIYSLPAEVTDEEAAKLSSYNAMKRSMTIDKRRRAKYVGEMMLESGIAGLTNTGVLFVESAENEKYATNRFTELAGIENVPIRASEWLIATRWDYVDNMTQDELRVITNGRRKCDDAGFGKHVAIKFAKLLRALVADGYVASESELALLKNCEKTVKEG